MEMPLFPEDLKNRVLAETIAHSFSSPRAKQMKSFMDHMNYVPREKRQGFIKEALSVYINEKKSDKTDFDAVGETKHSAAMLSRNRFLVAQKSDENEIGDDGNFLSRNRFVVARKSGENEIDDDGNPISSRLVICQRHRKNGTISPNLRLICCMNHIPTQQMRWIVVAPVFLSSVLGFPLGTTPFHQDGMSGNTGAKTKLAMHGFLSGYQRTIYRLLQLTPSFME
ncbi:hypothetical protein IV203_034879 [Nitzschia inconspicua]|uniref:Uncharacterized protein n=1 Tax=Nitzschia inconspicua TaxID=303405 RepID=A0A9K3LF71_9STRA|nr:hypothetical protein IV203_034879 [Nitzschia inconspicua]